MALDALTAALDDPDGYVSFEHLSAHEIIEIAAALRHPSLGILLNRGTATCGDHLEPAHLWRVPLRGAIIVIKKGMFSGSWDVDFNRFGTLEGQQFWRHVIASLDSFIASGDTQIFTKLQSCDMQGCPLGHVNWN